MFPIGVPIPDSPHAVSVSMPTWGDVVAYEENDPDVLATLKTAYPRFKLNPFVERLCTLAREGKRPVWLFPTQRVAQRCAAFVCEETNARAAVRPFRSLWAVETESQRARLFWQHTGLGISSRLAAASLETSGAEHAGGTSVMGGAGSSDHVHPRTDAKLTLKETIAELTGAQTENVWLYPTGMAAFDAAFRVSQTIHPHRATAQLGFPYVDSLKLQQAFGRGTWFRPDFSDDTLAALESELQTGSLAAVFTEVPSNPLLETVDISRVQRAAAGGDALTVIDDSLGGLFNLNLLPVADILVASLTKYFNGRGDAMGGALVVNPNGPKVAAIGQALAAEQDLLFEDDAQVLLKGAQDFAQRMTRVNETTAGLVAWLSDHSAVERIHCATGPVYRALKHARGGSGGVFSLELENKELAPAFFDALNVAKGPSFGMNVTLACPYTLLAHYQELEWAASCNVRQQLIRVSVGLESLEELVAVFRESLAGAGGRG